MTAYSPINSEYIANYWFFTSRLAAPHLSIWFRSWEAFKASLSHRFSRFIWSSQRFEGEGAVVVVEGRGTCRLFAAQGVRVARLAVPDDGSGVDACLHILAAILIPDGEIAAVDSIR